MDTCFEQGVTQLSSGERLCLDDATEHTVALVDGMVWITQSGGGDAFLTRGDRFAFKPGSAIVEAITNARLIESPERTQSATTESLFADDADQFNLNDIGLAMRFSH